MKNTSIFALVKVASSLPSHKRMSGTNDNPSARDSIAQWVPCLTPDNSIMLGVTRIDLGENNQTAAETEREHTHFRLINVVCNEILIQ